MRDKPGESLDDFSVKGKPKTEHVARCDWPVKCPLEARYSVIDFGLNPPKVMLFCKGHADEYKKLDRPVVVKELVD